MPGSAMRVEAAQVRGVDSSGMICSAYDLGWSEEAAGVPAFVPKSAALGSPYPDEPFPVSFWDSEATGGGSSSNSYSSVCLPHTLRHHLHGVVNLYTQLSCRPDHAGGA